MSPKKGSGRITMGELCPRTPVGCWGDGHGPAACAGTAPGQGRPLSPLSTAVCGGPDTLGTQSTHRAGFRMASAADDNGQLSWNQGKGQREGPQGTHKRSCLNKDRSSGAATTGQT